jgi:hypothetical protein
MRNLFLLILLINLLAFAYQNWIIEPDISVEPTFFAQDVPELMLAPVSRAPQQKAGAVAVVETGAAISDVAEEDEGNMLPDYRCMRVGSFRQESDAAAARAILEKREATVRQTAVEGRVWVGYWVQTAGQGSRAAAEKTRQSLIEGGMPDVYILADSDNRISLGVFRLRSSADKVVQRARKMGLDTRVIERYQPGQNYWLLVRMPADQLLQPGDIPSVAGQILRTENVSCSEAGI